MNNETLGPALLWEDLAEMYDKIHGGRKARTLPMNEVFAWAKEQPGIVYDSETTTLHKVLK
jgi:hypothetical protein